MNNNRKLNHTTYDCKYHIVWIPKYRKKVIYGQLRKYLGEVFRDLALQRESNILEGHLMGDHVHMLIPIPPKYSVAQVVGYIKGKSAIYIARTYAGKKRNFVGQNFWARGYYVSTVGRDEETVRKYIQKQESAEKNGSTGTVLTTFRWFTLLTHRFKRFTIQASGSAGGW
jgi:putative transposase